MATTAPASRVRVREMTRRDLRAVRALEAAAYGPANPRTPFARELDNGLAPYLVAVASEPDTDAGAALLDDRGTAGTAPAGTRAWWQRLLGMPPAEPVLGFAGVWFTPGQLHIVTIAVEPGSQHRGIARRLLLRCFELARDAELPTIALEARASNERAIRLYEAFGFRASGRLRGYYRDDDEDATVMLSGELGSAEQEARLRGARASLGEERRGDERRSGRTEEAGRTGV